MDRLHAWRHALSGIALASLLAGAAPTLAQTADIPGYPGVEAFDPREIRLLPPYCVNSDTFRDRIPGGKNLELIEQWYQQMGQTFGAIHHYCYALMKTNRAVLLAQDERTRTFYLRDSLTEFDYVIRHAPDDFYLLPEILSRKGENLIRLGMAEAALLQFQRAIELKPDYWPPYAHLSDHYRRSGNLKEARAWLEKGLAKNPDAKGLTRRMAELENLDRPGKPKR